MFPNGAMFSFPLKKMRHVVTLFGKGALSRDGSRMTSRHTSFNHNTKRGGETDSDLNPAVPVTQLACTYRLLCVCAC